jgi:hypothetical protein
MQRRNIIERIMEWIDFLDIVVEWIDFSTLQWNKTVEWIDFLGIDLEELTYVMRGLFEIEEANKIF